MTLKDLINEMFTSADLSGGLDWAETPDGVSDSHTGAPSKLPIEIPDEFREDKKKKKKKKLKIQRRK